MKAVVYKSGTGFTSRYAEMISQKLGIPAYTLESAKKELAAGTEIIYLGWVNANKLVGLKAAEKRFSLSIACAVGLYPKSAVNTEILVEKNKPTCPLLYLRGGLDYTKLRGFNKLMMRLIRAMLEDEKKPENAELLEVMTNGGDFVSEENIAELVAFALLKTPSEKAGE